MGVEAPYEKKTIRHPMVTISIQKLLLTINLLTIIDYYIYY